MGGKEQANEKPIALEAYETLAERYAALADSKAENAYVERPAMLSLLPEVEGKRVLNAGCGPGWYSEWLVDHGAWVVAIDVSPKMVELAKRRLGARVEVHQADLSKPLDFLEDASFDLILCPLVLDYIRDWEGVFKEFFRLLRPAPADLLRGASLYEVLPARQRGLLRHRAGRGRMERLWYTGADALLPAVTGGDDLGACGSGVRGRADH